MQPNGAFELLDMFNGALAKLWMIDIVIDIKFYSTVFLFGGIPARVNMCRG